MSGRLMYGAVFPPVRVLAGRYEVSAGMVHRGLGLLVAEGLIAVARVDAVA